MAVAVYVAGARDAPADTDVAGRFAHELRIGHRKVERSRNSAQNQVGGAVAGTPFGIDRVDQQVLVAVAVHVPGARDTPADRIVRRFGHELGIGQGEIEYGRIVTQLARCKYKRTVSVDIHDTPTPEYEMQPEVRKLKYLLESLI